MRMLILTFVILLSCSPAFAYIEEDTVGMAEATAGEQNTNMHKLNARGDYFVKNLKKIDEYAQKNKGAVLVDLSNIGDINDFEKKNSEELQNKKMAEEVARAVVNTQQLRVVVKPDVYSSLHAINEVRDTQIVSVLQKQLRGKR